MSWFVVDIESDGPIPGDYSMIALGAVKLDYNLDKTFKSLIHPISDKWVPEALAVSGYSREDTLNFFDPTDEMIKFDEWITSVNTDGNPRFISDNNGFDWMFICWYFHHFLDKNPFGFSSTNLGSLYKGLVKDTRKNFKHLRKTKHTHDPVDDAIGNAEAILAIQKQFGIRL